MRRLILPRGKTIGIGICAIVYLFFIRVIREGAWNDYAVWRGTCPVISIEWKNKVPSMGVLCRGEARQTFDASLMVGVLQKKTSEVRCAISKNNTTSCE